MKKSQKKYLIFTGVIAFAIICILILGNGKNRENEMDNENLEEISNTKEIQFLGEAEDEVERLKREYGVDISVEEMIKQLRIRDEYEKIYGKSYSMDEIFCVEVPEDDSVGDVGYIEGDLTQARIAAYKEKYDIDEERYGSMTEEEKLTAMQIEYGPLSEEEEQRIQEHMEGNEQSVTEYFEELKKQEMENDFAD